MNARQRLDRDHQSGRHDQRSNPDCFACASRSSESGFFASARCESGWTGDRCTKRLFHDGPHSNE